MNSKAGPRILLVEDEALIAMSEAEELTKFGYEVVTVRRGENALRAVEDDEGIDLVLMDIDLGQGMDGPQAAERILAVRDLPVVFLSCHTEPEIVEKTERITSYGYIVKNSSFTVYDTSIKMALRLFDANRKLKESEVKQKRMISNISDVIAVVDEDCRLRFLSDNAQRLFGWRVDELEGTEGWALLRPSDLDLARRRFQSLLDGGPSTIRGEFYVARSGGEFSPVELTATNMVGDPVVRGVLLNFHDISERKALEETQGTANRMFQAVLDAIPQYICWKDRNSVFLGCNKNHSDLFGLSGTQAIVGKTDWDLHRDDESIEKFIKDDSEVMEGDEPKYRIVEKAAYPDGRVRWLETNKVPLHDASGGVYGIMVAYSDITERKRIEDSLARERYLLGALMDNSSDFIYFKDLESRFLRTSRALAAFLGLDDPSAMIGKTDFDFYREDFAKLAFDDERQIMASGKTVRKEEAVLRKDGSETSVLIEKLPLRDEAGGVVGTFGISRDITDRKRVERRIQELLEEKELLLHEVHHRIKNSMSTICGLLRLQAARMKDAEGAKALEDAERRVQSIAILYELLHESADFADVRAKQYIPTLVDQVVEGFEGSVFVRVEYSIEDFCLGAETVQPLGIIITELLTNAMKHAFSGRDGGLIVISASVKNGKVRLSVGDDGIGIPEGVSFERSTGLGIALVGSLARQIGAEVRIERQGGTTVVLEFERQ